MKILLAHNRYRHSGGEDTVFALESNLLRENGHDVVEYVEDNLRIGQMNPLRLAARTVWSPQSRRKLTALLRDRRVDVAQFHNTVPLISPSAYYACRAAGTAVVQTLHNYRLICPAATFTRDGNRCEACSGRTIPWPGVLHGCYRGDRRATAALATMTAAHRLIGTWNHKVDVYIALTEFGRQKFIEGGLPADRIVVKPNCLDVDPGMGQHRGGYALFVGRLTDVKGVRSLIDAWRRIDPQRPLKIAGSGDLSQLADDAPASVEWLGDVSRERVLELMRDAAFLVFPSVWYEGFPMTLVEAFGTGLPVVCSRLGAMESIVTDRRTGLHFTAGDAADLAERVDWAFANPAEIERMGRAARVEFEDRYTPARNHAMLMDIYAAACERARA